MNPVLCPEHLRSPREWAGYEAPEGVPPGSGYRNKAQGLVEDMAVGDLAYVMAFALYADPDGRLWVESRNIAYPWRELDDEAYMQVERVADGVKIISWPGRYIRRQTPIAPVWVTEFR